MPSPLDTLSSKERVALHLQAAPAAFWVTTSDLLRVRSIASGSGTVVVSGAHLSPDGIVTPFRFAFFPQTDRTLTPGQIPLTDGWLLNVTVRLSSGALITGQSFALVELVRGGGSDAFVIATLVSGYVTAVQPLAWPAGRVLNSLEGRGSLRSITGTNPAAGAEVAETVPTGARWRLISCVATLVTDATVSNRQASILIDDGANVLVRSGNNVSQSASQTRLYIAAAFGAWGDMGSVPMGLSLPPDMWLLAGYRIATATVNLQAGDNWGAPQLLVEEFLEGAA